MDYLVLNQIELSPEGGTVEWEDYHFGDTAGSLILVNLAPEEGPRLHRHPYPEIFVVHEGQATYTVGTTTVAVQAGQIVVVSADVRINLGTYSGEATPASPVMETKDISFGIA